MLIKVFEHIAPALDLYTRLGVSPLRKELPRRIHDDSRQVGTADAISDLDALDLVKSHRRQTLTHLSASLPSTTRCCGSHLAALKEEIELGRRPEGFLCRPLPTNFAEGVNDEVY